MRQINTLEIDFKLDGHEYALMVIDPMAIPREGERIQITPTFSRRVESVMWHFGERHTPGTGEKWANEHVATVRLVQCDLSDEQETIAYMLANGWTLED